MNDIKLTHPLRCAGCSVETPLFPFSMAFQPVVDLAQGGIHAHEALVRGMDGSSARSVLEQVTDQNRYAFDQSCRVKAIELAARLGLQGNLNINFLPNAVYDPRACIKLTLDAARRTGFPTDRITFEIVEGEQIAEETHLTGIIAEYRRQGFRIALDDFGTSYSGLSRLARLKPDIVKLDRDLIAGCDRDMVKREIVVAMVGLGRAIGVELVAEGVETASELSVLRDAGIRFVQGFYFARPAFERVVQESELAAPALRPEPEHASAFRGASIGERILQTTPG
jgi:EAL domain-containing protein (putative c-di-GMP-specific phosphodiesterase class I)